MFFHMAVGVILAVRGLSGAALSYGLRFFPIDFWAGENFSAAKKFFLGIPAWMLCMEMGSVPPHAPVYAFFYIWAYKISSANFYPPFFLLLAK